MLPWRRLGGSEQEYSITSGAVLLGPRWTVDRAQISLQLPPASASPPLSPELLSRRPPVSGQMPLVSGALPDRGGEEIHLRCSAGRTAYSAWKGPGGEHTARICADPAPLSQPALGPSPQGPQEGAVDCAGRGRVCSWTCSSSLAPGDTWRPHRLWVPAHWTPTWLSLFSSGKDGLLSGTWERRRSRRQPWPWQELETSEAVCGGRGSEAVS